MSVSYVFRSQAGAWERADIRPDESIAKKWWNIAVRIEDNILVTKNGHEILSKDMVKEVKDIETLVQTKMSD